MQYPDTRKPGTPTQTGRYRWLALMLLAGALLAGCSQTDLQGAQGEAISWDEYRGQWVLVNYWAEWCKPCLEEIPELNHLDKAPDITVLGVNFDGVTGDELVQLGQTMGIEFTMLGADPGSEFGWVTPAALPATFVVDPQGQLLEVRFGPQTEEELRELIGGQS